MTDDEKDALNIMKAIVLAMCVIVGLGSIPATVVTVVLKATEVIDWSWGLTLSPLLGLIGLVVALAAQLHFIRSIHRDIQREDRSFDASRHGFPGFPPQMGGGLHGQGGRLR